SCSSARGLASSSALDAMFSSVHSSLALFLPNDGQSPFVTKDGVVEKHVSGHVMHIMTFPNTLWVMFGPNEAHDDSSQLAVPFVHEASRAGLGDKFGHLDASRIRRVDQSRARLHE